MSDQEKPDFTVTDRRHAASSPAETKFELETPSDAAPPAPENDAPAEMELPEPGFLFSFAAMNMGTQDLASALMSVFDGHAWRGLGLVSDPRVGQTQQDLPAAQLAIDCLRFLLEKVGSALPPDERRDAQRRLNDLQMNYLARLNAA